MCDCKLPLLRAVAGAGALLDAATAAAATAAASTAAAAVVVHSNLSKSCHYRLWRWASKCVLAH